MRPDQDTDLHDIRLAVCGDEKLGIPGLVQQQTVLVRMQQQTVETQKEIAQSLRETREAMAALAARQDRLEETQRKSDQLDAPARDFVQTFYRYRWLAGFVCFTILPTAFPVATWAYDKFVDRRQPTAEVAPVVQSPAPIAGR
jgi:hypothetical protein